MLKCYPATWFEVLTPSAERLSSGDPRCNTALRLQESLPGRQDPIADREQAERPPECNASRHREAEAPPEIKGHITAPFSGSLSCGTAAETNP